MAPNSTVSHDLYRIEILEKRYQNSRDSELDIQTFILDILVTSLETAADASMCPDYLIPLHRMLSSRDRCVFFFTGIS